MIRHMHQHRLWAGVLSVVLAALVQPALGFQRGGGGGGQSGGGGQGGGGGGQGQGGGGRGQGGGDWQSGRGGGGGGGGGGDRDGGWSGNGGWDRDGRWDGNGNWNRDRDWNDGRWWQDGRGGWNNHNHNHQRHNHWGHGGWGRWNNNWNRWYDYGYPIGYQAWSYPSYSWDSGYFTTYNGPIGLTVSGNEGLSYMNTAASYLYWQSHDTTWDMYHNYRSAPGYRSTYREMYRFFQTAKVISTAISDEEAGLVGPEFVNQLSADLLEAHRLLQGVRVDVAGWTSGTPRAADDPAIDAKLARIDATLTEMMNVVGIPVPQPIGDPVPATATPPESVSGGGPQADSNAPTAVLQPIAGPQ
jgi:hypothetical protein